MAGMSVAAHWLSFDDVITNMSQLVLTGLKESRDGRVCFPGLPLEAEAGAPCPLRGPGLHLETGGADP